MGGFIWSAIIWLVLQIGLTFGAHYYLGSLDPMIKRGIFILSSTISLVIDLAFF